MNEYGVKLSCYGLMIELVERRENESVLDFCYRVIGCKTIDIVRPQNLDAAYCMIVDDEGLLAERPRFNVFASHLYGAHVHGQPIVGNAVLMKNRQDDDGVTTIWLDKAEASALADSIGNNVMSIVSELDDAIRRGVL